MDKNVRNGEHHILFIKTIIEKLTVFEFVIQKNFFRCFRFVFINKDVIGKTCTI